ncbi:TPA: hypothetical protein R1732_001460, partial [Campylobacter lari]|nr:hypothetical protein [Campylobacter lari]
NKPIFVGIFGSAENATFKNINVDYMGGGLKLSNAVHSSGFVAYSRDSSFSNISLNNINHINHENNAHAMIGGFVGITYDSSFSNISLNDIGNINNIGIDGVAIGGFVGVGISSSFSNISLSNIESIKNINGDGVNIGGFVGIGQSSLFSNISLSNIGDISGIGDFVSVGGFAGRNNLGGKYSKIYISDIKNISSEGAYNGIFAGGFIGTLDNSFNTDHREFSDITVKNIGNIVSANNFEEAYAYSGGFAGILQEGYFERISLENINSISSIASSSNDDIGSARAYSGGFAGGNNRVDKSTYNINNISLKGIKNITSEAKDAYAGGFAGQLTNNYSGNSSSINSLKNIYIERIDHIKANGRADAQAGGFAGSLNYVDIDNVELNNIKEIKAEAFGKESFSTSAGGFVGSAERYLNFENIVLNNFGSISANGSYPANNHAGGFGGYIYSGFTEIPKIFNNISLNNFGSIIAKNSAGGFVGYDRGIKMSNISLNNINYIQGGSAGGFAGHSESSYENIVLNNIKHIKGTYAGGFTGYGTGGKNIYIYFDKGAIIEGSESSGKFFGHLNEQFIPDTENTYIYYHKDDLTNANIDQKYWELYKWIELRPYDDNSQGYIDFKTAALTALNGLKEIDCGAGKKCLVFTKDFEIEKPSNPNISKPNYPNNVIVSKPSQNTDYIPSVEDIINKEAVLDENDLYKDIIINEIIADLKNKYYTIDIADLKAILEAYKNLDKNSAEARTKFIMDYFFDKNNKDNPSMEIAQKEIFQSLDFLLAYQDNGLSKAGDDKFASKEAIQVKNDILTEVSNSLENKTIASNLENLSNLNDKINSANN